MLVRVDELRSLATSPNAWTPPVDIYETEDAVLVHIEVPGVSLEQLRIRVLDNAIKIEGRKERQNPTGKLACPDEERPVRFVCLERSYGSFAFNLSIKWQIEAERVTAHLSSGILHIRLPKQKTSGREITIPITE